MSGGRTYPERQLLSTLVRRADLRKQGIGEKDDRRHPTEEEGLRIARPLLASIPKKITLDAEGEYESVSKLLAALLKPPMGEDSPKSCKDTLSSPNPNGSTATPSGATTWSLIAPTRPSIARSSGGSGKAAGRSGLRRAKIKIASHPPVKTGPPCAQPSDPVRHRAPGSSRCTATGHVRFWV